MQIYASVYRPIAS